MKLRLIAAAFALLATASAVSAACPKGTRYDCQASYGGKQSCGCR